MKYASYEDYKSSASDWLGFVPSHWHVDRLKWSTNGCYNGVWGDDPNDLYDLICVRVADFDRDRFVVVDNPPTVRAIEAGQRRNRLLQRNDLLIEKSGGGEKQLVGCVVQFTGDFPAVCSNFVARLPIARGCDPRYLTYLHSAIYAARLNYPAIKQTTGIQNLDSGEYLNISAAYPPLDEQQAIARFLDAKTAQIDALVTQKRQLIAKLKEKRSALIARTVTRGLPPEVAKAAGLEPNPEMKDSKVDWIGYIPSDWKVERLRRVCRRVTDGAHISPDLSSDDFPFVSTVDIANGKIDMKYCLRTSVECYEYLVRTGCKPFSGDVLFSKDGTVGRTTVVDFSADFVVASSLVIISPDSRRLDSRFLDYWLNSSLLQQEVTLQMAGAALRRISVEKIGRLPVLLPPPNEQKAIVLYLEEKGGQLEALVAKAEAAIDRLTEYRQALITSAVTGKIDVRNWQSELVAA